MTAPSADRSPDPTPTLLLADWDGHVYRIPRTLLSAGLAAGGDPDPLVFADWDGFVLRLPRAALAPYRVTTDTPAAAPRNARRRPPLPHTPGRLRLRLRAR